MFRLEVLPARYGDCLWIEYGDAGSLRRILIDGGASGVYKKVLKPRLQNLQQAERSFELLIVTHVDYDHIRGIIELSHDDKVGFEARDVWFNGFRHIPDKPPEVLAGKHGEELTDLILRRGANWNKNGFGGKAVVIPKEGPLPRVQFEGGLVLTLMSPTLPRLAELRKDWEESCKDIDISPEELEDARTRGQFRTLGHGDAAEPTRPDVEQLLRENFVEDNSAANGSSIAVLAEYGEIRILLAGDAHPSTLVEAIDRLGPDKLPLTACKLPHHGSRGSVSAELIERLACDSWIFSSDGAQFSHPHPEAVARVISHGGDLPKLYFNYLSDETRIWDDTVLREAYGYQPVYPQQPAGGLEFTWDVAP
ncbi:MAG TPA: MBL fold metallo-hydrolase [Woeseiaceae bacterium]|nr:MBL fold metallo-hydrolase [Woeseiaceae bacterium]